MSVNFDEIKMHQLNLNKQECQLMLACINLTINQFEPLNIDSEEVFLKIRSKIEEIIYE